MALRAIEGWDGFGSSVSGSSFSTLIRSKWLGSYYASSSRMMTESERFTDEKLFQPYSDNQAWLVDLPDNPEEVAAGIYLKNGKLGYSREPTQSVLAISNGSAEHIAVFMSGRDLQVRFNNSSTTGAVLIPNVVEPRQWVLIELKGKVHDTTGYWYLYVNGVLVGSETGRDTKYLTYNVNQVRFWGYDSYEELSDCYVVDLTGAQNNDVLGPFHVQGLVPDANGSDTDWTPSGGPPNYQMVWESPASDAEYNESGNSNDKDLYNYEDLDGTWDEIFGVQINTRMLVDAANSSETVAIICESNGTEDSANFTVDNDTVSDGDEAQFRRIIEVDPDTSNAWDANGIDAAQFGVEFI